MKSILISIKPEHVAKILNKEKTVEIRKNAPKEFYYRGYPTTNPELITGYIYCTKNGVVIEKDCGLGFPEPINGKVVAKFAIKEMEKYEIWDNSSLIETSADRIGILKESCLSGKELSEYLGGTNGKVFYAYYISDLVIFDEPKELWEFGLKRAPQSWQYVVYPYGFKVGEKVKLTPQCAEYIGKEDNVYEVLGKPKCIGGSHCTPICYNGINQYFATEYLTYAEVEGLENLTK